MGLLTSSDVGRYVERGATAGALEAAVRAANGDLTDFRRSSNDTGWARLASWD